MNAIDGCVWCADPQAITMIEGSSVYIYKDKKYEMKIKKLLYLYIYRREQNCIVLFILKLS